MKNTGVCPKCGGSDILMVPSDALLYQGDPHIRAAGSLGASRADGINVHRCVCCSCGYVEQWIDPEELKRRPNVRRELEKRMEKWREERELQDYWNRKAAEKEKQDGQETQRKDDPWN